MDQELHETNSHGEQLWTFPAIEKFHYNPSEDVEDLCYYKPGGYHPVKLGDLFPSKECSRYRVLHKLGWGASSTVWLATDAFEESYVALKILTAEATAKGHEAQLLLWLRDQSTDHPGYEHIAHILNHFQINGPNGNHDVLVMKPLVSLFWMQFEASDILDSHVKSLVNQSLHGVSYLHNLGVTHGDLHLGNLTLVLDIDDYSEFDILFYFGPPECTVVLPFDMTDQTASLPPYVVQQISLGDLVLEELRTLGSDESYELTVKIKEFGNAFRRNDKRPSPQPFAQNRAPEIEIWERTQGKAASDWGIQADIWSLGCMIYGMTCYRSLFYRWKGRDDFLLEIAKYGGPFLTEWVECLADRKCEAITRPASETRWTKLQSVLMDECPEGIAQDLWKEDIDLFFGLIRRMIITNPQDRSAARELLNHPWFGREIGGAIEEE